MVSGRRLAPSVSTRGGGGVDEENRTVPSRAIAPSSEILLRPRSRLGSSDGRSVGRSVDWLGRVAGLGRGDFVRPFMRPRRRTERPLHTIIPTGSVATTSSTVVVDRFARRETHDRAAARKTINISSSGTDELSRADKCRESFTGARIEFGIDIRVVIKRPFDRLVSPLISLRNWTERIPSSRGRSRVKSRDWHNLYIYKSRVWWSARNDGARFLSNKTRIISSARSPRDERLTRFPDVRSPWFPDVYGICEFRSTICAPRGVQVCSFFRSCYPASSIRCHLIMINIEWGQCSRMSNYGVSLVYHSRGEGAAMIAAEGLIEIIIVRRWFCVNDPRCEEASMCWMLLKARRHYSWSVWLNIVPDPNKVSDRGFATYRFFSDSVDSVFILYLGHV